MTKMEMIGKEDRVKPILKWAGGKTQLLKDLMDKVPENYGKYIEPFFGGGALFFALNPERSVIADSNPELVNMYREVANNVYEVMEYLREYSNNKEEYYSVRSKDWTKMDKTQAAARTIYLNKTCFNGLYRVNRNGQFNVPYGKYKNPKICDEETLLAASKVLQKAKIVCGDYIDVLKKYSSPGDFVFLDPPYLPISDNSDFKRYTKEQFYEDDHKNLSKVIEELHFKGCYVILTNSNHPLVHELYSQYRFEVVQTKRHISCNGKSRKGEDVIVTIPPTGPLTEIIRKNPLPEQVSKYPPTRYMGSKSKLLSEIWAVASGFKVEKVLDLFSGSGIVGYMFKAEGKTVVSNDYMAMAAVFSKAMIENNGVTLSEEETKRLMHKSNVCKDFFVRDTFRDLYFTEDENTLIDIVKDNISTLNDPYKEAIAMSALIRACTKKRPRGIFTFTGQRYNDGRKDLQKSLETHFVEAVTSINQAVFDNRRQNRSYRCDSLSVDEPDVDLVYIDPPYYSPLSDNEYVRRYHFVEGLARNWDGVKIQESTKTKKFKSYPTPFSSLKGTEEAFEKIFERYSNSVLIVSYSSNSLPNREDMIAMMSKYKTHVEVIPVDYKYSFGNQNDAKTNRNIVQEYLFVGY